ncbi:MAG: aminopeptidase, partial [Spirochaetales bacterium]
MRTHNFYFSNETKRGEITSQKSSGRCWIFAALNAARVKTMEQLNLETFEFSQNHTLFWDKLEKSNYFLESILET